LCLFIKPIVTFLPMHPLLKAIRAIEFEQIQYDSKSDDYFGIIEGSIPILLSAPHGAKHLRDGRWKGEDEYTSSLAIELGSLTGASVIFVKNKTEEDSNYLSSTRYKDAIRELVAARGIKFLADLHGADIARDYKMSVGIIDEEDMGECSCPRCKPVIEEAIRAFQYPLFNLDDFTAGSPETVTFFARHICGIEAAQFEINARYRIVERKPDSTRAMHGDEPHFKAEEADVLALVQYLEEMVLRIKEEIC
jgi:hypothetical protein